jgi:hypothetical protein
MKDAMDELVQKYFLLGYPSAEELVAAQGLTFPRDPRDLLGNFWPEEESIDDFLAAMRAAACNTLPSRRMADGRDALTHLLHFVRQSLRKLLIPCKATSAAERS